MTRAVVSPRPWTMSESLKAANEKRRKQEDEYNDAHIRASVSPAESTLAGFGVPKRYRRARITDFAGLELTKPNDDGLFLTSAAGRGKTHLATSWMVAMLKDCLIDQNPDGERRAYVGWSVLWASAPEILQELRATFGGHGDEREVLKKYIDAKLLVLDDLGAEQSTDWTGQALYQLISRRLNDCKPTIVTSNLTLAEMHKRDPRLASRLGGMAYQKLEGKDRRLERAAQ